MQHDNVVSASSASENDTNNSDYNSDRCLQHDTCISRHNSPKGHGNATDLTSEHDNTNERTILLHCKNTADIHGTTKTTTKRESRSREYLELRECTAEIVHTILRTECGCGKNCLNRIR